MAELPFRVALVGCGAVAQAHARALAGLPDARCTVVFDPDHRRADALRRAYAPLARVAAGLDEVPGHAQAAVVAVPNAQHAAVSMELLSAGLHVLCEKPLAVSLAEAERMIAAAREADRLLLCGLVRRFCGSTELVAEVLRRRLLGAPSRIEVTESVTDWPLGRAHFARESSGGGVLIDLAPHLFDLLAVWFGPVEVTGYADDQRGGVEATAVAEVRCGRGAEAIPATVRLSRGYRMPNRARIFCPQGHIEVDPHRPDRIRLALGNGAPIMATAETAPGDPFAAQLAAFQAAVRGTGTPRASAEEALATVALVEDCYRRRAQLPEAWTVAAPPLDGRLARFGKVLVTGATGAVGSRLVERWAAAGMLGRLRCMVRGYRRAARILRFPVDVVEADLLDRASLSAAARGCDAIVHLAVGERAGAETQALVDTAIEHGIRRFVHMSTAVVYGRGLPAAIEDRQEDTPLARTGEPYADQKAAAERAVLGARDRLDAHLLRPHIVYGPGLRWSGELVELLPRGNVPVIEDGGWCNLVHVDDLVDAVACALAADRGFGEPLFITDGAPHRWSEYIAAHAALLGLEPPRVRRRDTLPRRLTGPEWLRASLRPLLPVARSGEFRRFLLESPLMRATVTRAYLAVRGSPRLEPYFGRLRGGGTDLPAPPRFDPTWTEVQHSQARLSGERAAREIGFRARIDFALGLRRTALWFEAMGLVPACPAPAPARGGA